MAKKETVSEQVVEQEVPTTEDSGTPEQQAVESITLRDLDQIAQIIDLGAQRGAFKGNEMTVVGSLYDKLAMFLGNVKEQQDAAKAAAEAEGVDVAEAPEEK
jgi:hypothetical protein|tara:strand:- start:99 stop:404 length:306 start_codon:yes stop_codon:yes gene_type:complete